MRVISQDGRTDIPYEMFVFGVTKDNAIVGIRDTISRPSDIALGVIAKYSTKEKALKVMQMLRDFKATTEIRSVPLTKSLLENFANLKKENFEIYTDCSGEYVKVDVVKKIEYFQFPKDEDLEV